MSKLRVLDLFSGIGGFSLGLERTGGFETVAFCEIEDYPVRVLNKHWPDVPVYRDVRELTYERLREDGITVDVITAGFPCQDISTAGKGAGIRGERSGLWSEVARLAGEIRPRYLILENVAALLGRGLDVVLGDLAEIGVYGRVEWHCIPASAVGAPHRRDRWWCVAYAAQSGGEAWSTDRMGDGHRSRWHKRQPAGASCKTGDVADTYVSRLKQSDKAMAGEPTKQPNSSCVQSAENVSNPDQPRSQGRLYNDGSDSEGREKQGHGRTAERSDKRQRHRNGNRTIEPGLGLLADGLSTRLARSGWLPEPRIGRVATGVPDRTHKLRALGNSVVPQIPELIGRAILETIE